MLKNMLLILTHIAILVFSLQAGAKDMTHRLGVGLQNNTSIDLPSVAVVYYAEKTLAFTGSVGFDTQKNYSQTQLSGGARKVVFLENNLNAYVGGQVSLVSTDDPVNGKGNGLEFTGTGGVEFYFSGLENLAFTAEAGLGLSTVRNTRIRTVANDPFKAGILFYF
jgi:hypothetical protein